MNTVTHKGRCHPDLQLEADKAARTISVGLTLLSPAAGCPWERALLPNLQQQILRKKQTSKKTKNKQKTKNPKCSSVQIREPRRMHRVAGLRGHGVGAAQAARPPGPGQPKEGMMLSYARVRSLALIP